MSGYLKKVNEILCIKYILNLKNGYWGSYNNPYFAEIREYAGYTKAE